MQLYATCICIIFMLLSPSWPFPALHHTNVAHINPHHPGHHPFIESLRSFFFSWGYQWYSPNPTHVWANLAPFLTSPTAVSFASASCHHDHRQTAQVGSAALASDARRTPRQRPGLMGPRGSATAHRWRAVGGVFSLQEELASRVPGLLPQGRLDDGRGLKPLKNRPMNCTPQKEIGSSSKHWVSGNNSVSGNV